MADTKENAAPVADATTQPATAPTDTSPRFGRGILIGAAAAALVTGLAVGGAGGFALAQAGDRGPAAVGQGPMQGGQGPMQGGQGPAQGGPGLQQGGPGQGGPHGPGGQPPHDAPHNQGGQGGTQNGQGQQGQHQSDDAPQDVTPEG